MRWDSIAKVHDLRFVKSLSVWFVALPILAKAIQSSGLPAPWAAISLPFTWGIFYLASLFFFLAMAVYAYRCPAIVKEYRGWSEFLEREGSFEKLIPLICEVLYVVQLDRRVAFVLRHLETKHLKFQDALGGDLPRQKLMEALADRSQIEAVFRRSRCEKNHLSDLYASAREEAQKTRPLSRRFIELAQALGFLLLFWVAIENALYVLGYYFPDLVAKLTVIGWRFAK